MRNRPDMTIRSNESEFVKSHASATSWGNVISMYQSLLGLRGFWPFSAITDTPTVIDLSGSGKPLSYTGAPELNYRGVVPYMLFDGTNDYLYHADHADFDILGNEGEFDSSLNGLTCR